MAPGAILICSEPKWEYRLKVTSVLSVSLKKIHYHLPVAHSNWKRDEIAGFLQTTPEKPKQHMNKYIMYFLKVTCVCVCGLPISYLDLKKWHDMDQEGGKENSITELPLF